MHSGKTSRRTLFKGALAAAAMASMPEILSGEEAVQAKSKRIRQSVSRWCYENTPLDQLCAYAAQIGLLGIDLLEPQDYELPRRFGLICTMGYAGGGEISRALNRPENHAAIEAGFRKNIPLAAKSGVPNVITFS